MIKIPLMYLNEKKDIYKVYAKNRTIILTVVCMGVKLGLSH
jgi:hypothetical protein